MTHPTKTIAIVGGGAGGMCAALSAAESARQAGIALRVVLIERNDRLGIKILISGGGKCNITHDGEVETVLREGFLYENERRWLKHAMYRFTNRDVLTLLDRHGVHWHSRENGRIFPDSSRAEDVLIAFERELRKAGVELMLGTRVRNVEHVDQSWKLLTDNGELTASALIMATGGISYRKVGTTGDGIDFAQKLGHTIVPLRAALAPIYLQQLPPAELQGVALRDVVLAIRSGEKTITEIGGDVLLTHKGISGPPVLDSSREAALAAESGPVTVEMNLLKQSSEELRQGLPTIQQERSQQQVKRWLEELLPNRFVPWMLSKADIPEERKWNALTKDERNRLLTVLTRFPLGPVRDIPIDRGEVTAGGVSLKEVSSKTMMSRLHPNLFFVGEMLDIAGEIGGFNLQAAYSTGWVAGEEAVKSQITPSES